MYCVQVPLHHLFVEQKDLIIASLLSDDAVGSWIKSIEIHNSPNGRRDAYLSHLQHVLAKVAKSY